MPTRDRSPAAGVYDGAERVEDQNVRDLFIVTSAAVELWTLKLTIAEALKDLNDKLGLVRLTVGANQQLGGLSTRVRYLGCDEPDIVAPTEAPAKRRCNYSSRSNASSSTTLPMRNRGPRA